jgi:quercetin dioxygenase-like cupin family protein
MRTLAAIVLLIATTMAIEGRTGQEPVVVAEVLSTTMTAGGQPIILPQGPVRLVATMVEIAPGAKLPVHKHPFPRYAYVLNGTLTVTEAETGTKYPYKAGDFIVEVVDRWHSGENTGADPVRLLVIDQVPDGSASTILRQP